MSQHDASREDQPTDGERDLTAAEQELLAGLLSCVEEHGACSAEHIDWARVQEVFVWACVHLADEQRTSGEEFIIHPVGVARICTGLRLGTEALCAALLHDSVDGTPESQDEVRAAFGEEIAGLVDGITKLVRPTFRPRDEAQAKSYRKMVMAIAEDIRVILIKLACRLDSMRRISAMPKQRQIEKARETLDIYAPIANRLGIHAVKWELEDLSFQTLHPRKYNEIKGLVGQEQAEREHYIKQAGKYLAKELDGLGIEAEISGRAKHLYSIYLKMTKQGHEFNEIFDLTTMHVIVGSVKDCYGTIGVVHSVWRPLPGRFKDFIAMPKLNGYQSLRTTVIGPEGSPMEIQVRTREMRESKRARERLGDDPGSPSRGAVGGSGSPDPVNARRR